MKRTRPLISISCPIDQPKELWVSFQEIRNVQLNSTYEISNCGTIRNLNNHILKPHITDDGYYEVGLPRKDGKTLNIRVHIIVLLKFAGDPPAHMCNPTVHHKNHNKLDNRIENLCWMSAFDNNQEGHGVRVKILDTSGEHIFNSQKVASHYLGRYEDYVSECISRGYRITSTSGEVVEVYTEVDKNWIKYIRPDPANKNRCKLVVDDVEHEFASFWQCDRFLNMPQGYVSNCIMNNWPILDVAHKFYRYDRDNRTYVEYIAKCKKKRCYAHRCRITCADGAVQTFASISKAANYIGRDSEYLRLAIRDIDVPIG